MVTTSDVDAAHRAAVQPPLSAWPSVARRWACAMGDVEKAPHELPPHAPRMSQRPADADDADYGALHRLGVHLVHTFVDLYVAFVTFGLYLFTFESLLLCVLSVGSVTFFTHWYSYHGACAPRQLARRAPGLPRCAQTRG